MRITQQVMQHEPGVARAFPDPAVDHDVVVWSKPGFAAVDRLQLLAGPERGVIRRSARPGDALGAGYVAATQRAFLWIVRHVQQLAGVLARRSHVDERLAEVRLEI